MKTDSSANILIVGDYANTIYFNNSFQTGSYISASSTSRNGFLAKYDLNGNFKWAINIESSVKDIVYAVATDAADNIYITGYFGGTVDFDPSASQYTLTSNGGRDIFLAKYDSSGAFKWAFNTGGTMSTAYEEGGMDLVVSGPDILLTGNFEGNPDFNPDPAAINTLQSNGVLDVFVAKYDTSGSYKWAISAGAANLSDFSHAIDVDGAGNIYVTGGIDGPTDFDPSSGNAILSPPSDGTDIFLAKYSGDADFVWAFNVGGNSVVNEFGYDLDVSTDGEIYLTGSFWGPADFDPSSLGHTIGVSNNNIFMARYNSSGQFVFAHSIGQDLGTGPADEGRGIHVTNDGTFYVTGDFYHDPDFDISGNSALILDGSNIGQAFLVAYDGNQIILNVEQHSLFKDLRIFPNPAASEFMVENVSDAIQSIEIINAKGELVKAIFPDNSSSLSISVKCDNIEPGLYLIRLTSGSDQLINATKLVIR